MVIADKIIGGQGLLPAPTPASSGGSAWMPYRAIFWTQELAWFHWHLHMVLLLEKKSVWKRELHPRQHVPHPPRAVLQPALRGASCCPGSAATDPLLDCSLPGSPSHSNLLPPRAVRCPLGHPACAQELQTRAVLPTLPLVTAALPTHHPRSIPLKSSRWDFPVFPQHPALTPGLWQPCMGLWGGDVTETPVITVCRRKMLLFPDTAQRLVPTTLQILSGLPCLALKRCLYSWYPFLNLDDYKLENTLP